MQLSASLELYELPDKFLEVSSTNQQVAILNFIFSSLGTSLAS